MDPFYRHRFTGWVNVSQIVVSHIPLVQSFPTRVPQNIVWGSARNGVINKQSRNIAKNSTHLCKYRGFILFGNWQYWSNFRALHTASWFCLGQFEYQVIFVNVLQLYCVCFHRQEFLGIQKHFRGCSMTKVWEKPYQYTCIIRNRKRLSVCSFKFFRQVIHTQ